MLLQYDAYEYQVVALCYCNCEIPYSLGILDKTQKNCKLAVIGHEIDYIGLQPMSQDEKMTPCQLRDSSGIKNRKLWHFACKNLKRQNTKKCYVKYQVCQE